MNRAISDIEGFKKDSDYKTAILALNELLDKLKASKEKQEEELRECETLAVSADESVALAAQ